MGQHGNLFGNQRLFRFYEYLFDQLIALLSDKKRKENNVISSFYHIENHKTSQSLIIYAINFRCSHLFSLVLLCSFSLKNIYTLKSEIFLTFFTLIFVAVSCVIILLFWSYFAPLLQQKRKKKCKLHSSPLRFKEMTPSKLEGKKYFPPWHSFEQTMLN